MTYYPKHLKMVLLVDWGPNLPATLIPPGITLGPYSTYVQRYSDFEDCNDEFPMVMNCVKEFSNYNEQRSQGGFGATKTVTVSFHDQFGFFFEVFNRFSLYSRDIRCKLIYVYDPSIYDNHINAYAVGTSVPGLYANEDDTSRVPIYALKRRSVYLVEGEELLFNGQFTSNFSYDFDSKILTADVISYQLDDMVGFIPQPRHVRFYGQSSTGYYDDLTTIVAPENAKDYAYVSALVNQSRPWPELFGYVADYPAVPLLEPAEFTTYKSQRIDYTATRANSKINVVPIQRSRLTDMYLRDDIRQYLLNPHLDYRTSPFVSIQTGIIDVAGSGTVSAITASGVAAGLMVGKPITPVLLEGSSDSTGEFQLAITNMWLGCVQGSDGGEFLTLNFYVDDMYREKYKNLTCSRVYPNLPIIDQLRPRSNVILKLDDSYFSYGSGNRDVDFTYAPDLLGCTILLSLNGSVSRYAAKVIRQEGEYCWLDIDLTYGTLIFDRIDSATKGATQVVDTINSGAVAFRPCDTADRIYVIDSKDDCTRLHDIKYIDKDGIRTLDWRWLTPSGENWTGNKDDYNVHRHPSKTPVESVLSTYFGTVLFDITTTSSNTLWDGIAPPCSYIQLNVSGMSRLRRGNNRQLFVSCSNLYDNDWFCINYLTLKYGQTVATTPTSDGVTASELVCRDNSILDNLPYTTYRAGDNWNEVGRSKTFSTGGVIRDRSAYKELGFNGFYTVPPKNTLSRYVGREWVWEEKTDQSNYYKTTGSGYNTCVSVPTEHSVNFVLTDQIQLSNLVADIAYQVGKNIREVNLGDDFGIELVDLLDVTGWEAGNFVNPNFVLFTPELLDADVKITITQTPIDEVVTNMKFKVLYNNYLRASTFPIVVEKSRNRNFFGERREAENEIDYFVYNGMYSHAYMNYWINKFSQPYLTITFAALMGEVDRFGRRIDAVQLYDFATVIPSTNSNPYMDSLAPGDQPFPFKNIPYREYVPANIGDYQYREDSNLFGYFGRIVDIQRQPAEGLIYISLEVLPVNPLYQANGALNPSKTRFNAMNVWLPKVTQA